VREIHRKIATLHFTMLPRSIAIAAQSGITCCHAAQGWTISLSMNTVRNDRSQRYSVSAYIPTNVISITDGQSIWRRICFIREFARPFLSAFQYLELVQRRN
jgi:F0F1-type ATP synthase alpha subunit